MFIVLFCVFVIRNDIQSSVKCQRGARGVSEASSEITFDSIADAGEGVNEGRRCWISSEIRIERACQVDPSQKQRPASRSKDMEGTTLRYTWHCVVPGGISFLVTWDSGRAGAEDGFSDPTTVTMLW